LETPTRPIDGAVKAVCPADSIRRFLTRVERGAYPCDWMKGEPPADVPGASALEPLLAGSRSREVHRRRIARRIPGIALRAAIRGKSCGVVTAP
jgi:hypothetical protein